MFDKLMEKALEIFGDTKELWESMNEREEWDSFAEIKQHFDDSIDLVRKVVECVELAAQEVGGIADSKEKKAAAVAMLDKMIVLPGVLEIFDGPAIGFVVDMVVGALNKSEWKKVE